MNKTRYLSGWEKVTIALAEWVQLEDLKIECLRQLFNKMTDGRTDIATPDGAKNHQHLTWAETVSRKKIAARQITRNILMPDISLKRWSATGWSGDSALYLWCSSLIYFSLMQLKLSSHWFITTQTVFPFAIGHMQVVTLHLITKHWKVYSL